VCGVLLGLAMQKGNDDRQNKPYTDDAD